uniref:sensor domain-containing diguanylate cyclase n=1 Tax=Pseudomonas laurentiana TaxID=2364649 RepID=UPI0029C85C55|nr:sensor domain-containing diguanylate cyclase [Pseudomonas laurentiana]
MSGKSLFKIDLRGLILLLAAATALITLGNALYSSYRVQRQQLIDNTLEANRIYAAKLAASTDQFLHSAQQQLAYSAGMMSKPDGLGRAVEEVERLKSQTDSFNSVTVADATGKVIAISPETIQIVGNTLTSVNAQRALTEQKPFISQPFVSFAGNLVVFISHPIVSDTGTYLGFIGGTIYLKQKSMLHSLLGSHFYTDSSYIYVVDENRRLLYHPDANRIGEAVGPNTVIDAVIRGESGKSQVVNTASVEMLAGYAPITSAHWGIISQQPIETSLLALNTLMLNMLKGILPVGLLGMFAIWWLARLISRPLGQLADCAKNMDSPEAQGKIREVKSWYFESTQIKRALLLGISLLQSKIGKLNKDAQTDPLTGLLNRRAMAQVLETYRSEQTAFSVVVLDIDHFKRVNDTYGHDTGDKVLVQLSKIMQKHSREADSVCRVGGEEFLILLPGTSLEAAGNFAERLRLAVEQASMALIGHITISLGVAHWPDDAKELSETLKLADDRMYQAKQLGRNRVVAHTVEGTVHSCEPQ